MYPKNYVRDVEYSDEQLKQAEALGLVDPVAPVISEVNSNDKPKQVICLVASSKYGKSSFVAAVLEKLKQASISNVTVLEVDSLPQLNVKTFEDDHAKIVDSFVGIAKPKREADYLQNYMSAGGRRIGKHDQLAKIRLKQMKKHR